MIDLELAAVLDPDDAGDDANEVGGGAEPGLLVVVCINTTKTIIVTIGSST